MTLSSIHVCSLSRMGEVVARTGADHLLSLLAAGTEVVLVRLGLVESVAMLAATAARMPETPIFSPTM